MPPRIERGPHGGRLLVDGDFTLELAIFEAGVPPEFHAWATADGRPLAPADVALTVELARLGGRVDRIEFAPQNDFLRGTAVVDEPHSFDVTIVARHAGRDHRFEYESYEGRTTIAADVARAAGIATATAGPGTISDELVLYGAIAPDATRVRAVHARFPGVIRAVSRNVGDAVRSGETLATIESNESLQTYAVTAPITGTVTARHAAPGEPTDDEALFEIADFSSVWAELDVFSRDRARLRTGLAVAVTERQRRRRRGIRRLPRAGRQPRVAERHGARRPRQCRRPMDAGAVRRGPRDDRDDAGRTRRPALRAAALPRLRRRLRAGRRDVRGPHAELGRRDARFVEVLEGLAPGTPYVTDNSYLIKADIEKSGASHDH